VTDYVPRLADSLIADLLTHAPAVMLTGPRASGKTTTATRHAIDTVRLDRAAEAAAFIADPDAALAARRTPLLVDEWQVVPEVLGAVKRSVDADPGPGRYVITGSARADLDSPTWPGTGRVVRLPVWPMSQRELTFATSSAGVLDRVLADGIDALTLPPHVPDLPGYLALAVAGGLPQAVLTADPAYRRRWLISYLEQLVTRDAEGLDGGRDPVRLRRYIDGLAENMSGLAADNTLAETAGLNIRTAAAYDRLLQALGVLDIVPSWSSNRLKRLTQRGKRYLVDTGLAAAALRVDADDVLRDGNLIGRFLDAYVAAQLRPDVAASPLSPSLYHLRDRDGHEIDLLLDYGRKGQLALEIKATAAPRPADAAHLQWLIERQPSVRAGLVLHTGPGLFQLSDTIIAAPIATLWS